jgi:hypothetical protein
MNTEVAIFTDSATTVYINHPEASYGIFCYNSKGDLFLNSDWGFYGYSWRHFGDKTFAQFLANTNAEYLCGKFAINHNNQMPSSKYWLKGNKEKNVTILLSEFINALKEKLTTTV